MSKFLSVSEKQWLHGLLMVVLGAIVGGIIDVLSAVATGGDFSIKTMLIAAATCGLAYIKKSLLSNQNGEFLKK